MFNEYIQMYQILKLFNTMDVSGTCNEQQAIWAGLVIGIKLISQDQPI